MLELVKSHLIADKWAGLGNTQPSPEGREVGPAPHSRIDRRCGPRVEQITESGGVQIVNSATVGGETAGD